MGLNFKLPEPEIKATATSGVTEELVLQRLQALGEQPQTDETEKNRRFLRKVLRQLRKA